MLNRLEYVTILFVILSFFAHLPSRLALSVRLSSARAPVCGEDKKISSFVNCYC